MNEWKVTGEGLVGAAAIGIALLIPFLRSRRVRWGATDAEVKRIIEDAAISKLPVQFQVLKVNHRAVAFYQRFGFKSTGESDTHVLMELKMERVFS